METAVQTGAQLDFPAEPDVYETAAAISSDESTSPKNDSTASPIDSGSESETAETSEDGPFGSISRRRLFPQRARSRFQALGSKVDSKGLDLSDRVDGRRRGLRIRSTANGINGEEETLEARIARLRREVEECRLQAQQPGPADATSTTSAIQQVHELGKVLAQLEPCNASAELKTTQQHTKEEVVESKPAHAEQITLSNIAAFDTRLASLERALGLASMDMAGDGTFTSPVLPSIDILDQQISALLAAASIMQLDAASSRIRKLAQDADQLSHARSVPGVQDAGETAADGDQEATFSQADMTKLNALYSLLPTLQGLAPTVPALLERLKSLSVLHSGAANAANELNALEKRQADTDAELKSWTEGLTRVEAVVEDASQANGRNGKVVQAWVKDLETRIAAVR